MSRTMINFLLDAALLLAFLGLLWCSCLVRFVFPPGPDSRGWKLWTLTFDDWNGVQFACVATLAIGILLHVMLHWNWVCGVLATRLSRQKNRLDDGTQTLYGVGLLIVIFGTLAVGFAAAALSIERP